MQIYISYFYQVRFFTPNMIPLSTAVGDPIWFHNMTRDQTLKFKDKNGVWNGLRAEPFVPGANCEGTCRGPEWCDTMNPDRCAFLRRYLIQLNSLDYKEILARFERLGNLVKNREGFLEEPIAVLLVHEAPNNPCSERWALKKWFAQHGYDLKEWAKDG